MKFDRRKFIKRLVVTAASLEVISLVRGSVNTLPAEKDNKNDFNAGKVTDFENGKTYPFTDEKFFLQRFEDGAFLALSVKCTHLGCSIKSEEEDFICPCHHSKFNKFGEVLESPAKRPLNYYPITIKNGEVIVDLKKSIKRDTFSKTQLIYP